MDVGGHTPMGRRLFSFVRGVPTMHLAGASLSAVVQSMHSFIRLRYTVHLVHSRYGMMRLTHHSTIPPHDSSRPHLLARYDVPVFICYTAWRSVHNFIYRILSLCCPF